MEFRARVRNFVGVVDQSPEGGLDCADAEFEEVISRAAGQPFRI